MTISEETEADFLGIAALTRAAFGGEYETGLTEKLRAAGLAMVSLVAIEEDSIVGHLAERHSWVSNWSTGPYQEAGSVIYPEAFGV
jgi:predicted N-acetyltransferase YhbS